MQALHRAIGKSAATACIFVQKFLMAIPQQTLNFKPLCTPTAQAHCHWPPLSQPTLPQPSQQHTAQAPCHNTMNTTQRRHPAPYPAGSTSAIMATAAACCGSTGSLSPDTYSTQFCRVCRKISVSRSVVLRLEEQGTSILWAHAHVTCQVSCAHVRWVSSAVLFHTLVSISTQAEPGLTQCTIQTCL